ncbi:C2 domain-containing protein [Melia azedarach]|uniref:C2 domain-containing protein n=1 Tax=Melia azedarach TaxID=155640 RepID=A0ACC1X5Q8_MELAZ|nr:C2 domain-containing protein [Melia azedarach]
MFGSPLYEVELILCSGKELKNVNWRNGPNRPYAVVYIDNGPKRTSGVDEEGDTLPEWNQSLIVPTAGPIDPEMSILFIDIVHAGNEEGTKPLIGQAQIRVGQILEEVGPRERVSRTLKLRRPSGRPQGKIDVQVCIRELRAVPPSNGYPLPQPVYCVPPPRPMHQHDHPHYPLAAPPTGYPIGPPQSSYGLPHAHCQPPSAPPAYVGATATAMPAARTLYGGPSPQPLQAMPAGVANRNTGSKFGLKSGLAAGAMGGLAAGALGGGFGGMALANGLDECCSDSD